MMTKESKSDALRKFKRRRRILTYLKKIVYFLFMC